MPIEPLRCKVCGGMLDANLKCQHCGTLHQKIENRLEIIKVCPKHLIGYSSQYCPKCVEERQATEELEKARRVQEQLEIEERHRRIAQLRAEHQEWKKSNYPKLKKIGIVALMCLIIGIAGFGLFPSYYMNHSVTVTPSKSGSITVENENGLNLSLTGTDVTVSQTYNYSNSWYVGPYIYYPATESPTNEISDSSGNPIPLSAFGFGIGTYLITFNDISGNNYPEETATVVINSFPTSSQTQTSSSLSVIGIVETLVIVIGSILLFAILSVVYLKSDIRNGY